MSIQVEGDSLAILKADLKSQRKQVRNLKKKSLWSRSLEEVMEKLVDIVHYLILEIHCAFGSNEYQKSPEGSESGHQRLGPAGLALHYANIIMQVDILVCLLCFFFLLHVYVFGFDSSMFLLFLYSKFCRR
ncbi:hypothetical protein E1A91_D06G222400v1 [Gossypium mustelinum]|uniref:DUF668 domain-containing protein n=1 Tax=Gossypium mustelinum TaxID=34275 RepID=A0A5D2ULK3_GOSMU|nr:hypothetical protein E1A91_D06G222400v1 [Gossypium mustelinum]